MLTAHLRDVMNGKAAREKSSWVAKIPLDPFGSNSCLSDDKN
jgi:hypothetical protein